MGGFNGGERGGSGGWKRAAGWVGHRPPPPPPPRGGVGSASKPHQRMKRETPTFIAVGAILLLLLKFFAEGGTAVNRSGGDHEPSNWNPSPSQMPPALNLSDHQSGCPPPQTSFQAPWDSAFATPPAPQGKSRGGLYTYRGGAGQLRRLQTVFLSAP